MKRSTDRRNQFGSLSKKPLIIKITETFCDKNQTLKEKNKVVLETPMGTKYYGI
jgi:hypothetical protein